MGDLSRQGIAPPGLDSWQKVLPMSPDNFVTHVAGPYRFTISDSRLVIHDE
jgi:hypothetical protein